MVPIVDNERSLSGVENMTVFAVDPRGFRIMCNDRQLERIYAHHPELNNFWATREDIRRAIADALMIYQSVKGENFHVYYFSRQGKNTELKVVVKFDEDNVGVLWAAQPSTVGQRRPGEVLIWPIMKS
jgi:hypothetical protein